MSRFAIVRADGRSNAQVILAYIKDSEPGQIHRYEELAAALEQGCARPYSRPAVQAAVRGALRQIGAITKRTLHAVPGVGYRVAYAREHMGLAVKRQDRAQVQIRRGLQLLQDVRFEEMDANTRKAHEAQLLISSALYRNMVALETRVAKSEQLIADLMAARD
jgi:hypothetical protein